jgi:hypothetical protein
MSEKQAHADKPFDFFSKTQKIIQKKISPLPYSKLAFLGIVVGIGLSIPYSIYEGLEHHWDKQDHIVSLENKARIDYYIQQINAITPDQFNKFIHYTIVSQTTYDDEMKLLVDSESKAAGTAQKDEEYADVGKTIDEAGKLITNFKTNTRSTLAQYQDIYARVKSGNGQTVEEKGFTDFLYTYHRFEQGIALVDDDVENKLNERMYLATKVNQRYNSENGIYTQYEDMKKARSINKIN